MATDRAVGPPTGGLRLPDRGIAASLVLLGVLLGGCVQQPPPEPADVRVSPPPWPAPRDAISYIEAAGLAQERMDTTTNQRTFELTVEVEGEPVIVPPWIGVDRYRAVQAPVHTHKDVGTVWLEGERSGEVTLSQFFVLWGVRMNEDCLGSVCGGVRVVVDGIPMDSDPGALSLSTVQRQLEVSVG